MSYEVFAPGPRDDGPSLGNLYRDYKSWCEPLFVDVDTVKGMEESTADRIDQTKSDDDLDKIMENVQKCLKGRLTHREAYGKVHGEESLDDNHAHVIRVLQGLWRRANTRKNRRASVRPTIITTTAAVSTTTTDEITNSLSQTRLMVALFIEQADLVFREDEDEDENKVAVRLVAKMVSKDHDELCEAHGIDPNTDDDEAFFFVAACLVSGFLHIEGIDENGPLTRFTYEHLKSIVRDSFSSAEKAHGRLKKMKDVRWYRIFHSHAEDRSTNGPLLSLDMHVYFRILASDEMIREDLIFAMRLWKGDDVESTESPESPETSVESTESPESPETSVDRAMRRNVIRNMIYYQVKLVISITRRGVAGDIEDYGPVLLIKVDPLDEQEIQIFKGVMTNGLSLIFRALFKALVAILPWRERSSSSTLSTLLDVSEKLKKTLGPGEYEFKGSIKPVEQNMFEETRAAKHFPVLAAAAQKFGDEKVVLDFFLKFYQVYLDSMQSGEGLPGLIKHKLFSNFFRDFTRANLDARRPRIELEPAYGPNVPYMTLVDYYKTRPSYLPFVLREKNKKLYLENRGTLM